jgi:hypothetical protein
LWEIWLLALSFRGQRLLFVPTPMPGLTPQYLTIRCCFPAYFFDSSIDTFLNSFRSFSSSKVDFLALAPAALTSFSVSDSDPVLKVSNSVLIFSIKLFHDFFIRLEIELAFVCFKSNQGRENRTQGVFLSQMLFNQFQCPAVWDAIEIFLQDRFEYGICIVCRGKQCHGGTEL